MNTYGVWKIEDYANKTTDDFMKKYAEKPDNICLGLKEVWEYCGGRLFRGRAGYGGVNNGVSYFACKVNKNGYQLVD